MILLSFLISVTFGVAPNLSDDFSHQYLSSTERGADGNVMTYPCMPSPMGLDYDTNLGLFWQATENDGWVYTVNPDDGTYTQRFNVSCVFNQPNLNTNGVYYDASNNYLYLTDYQGDAGILFNDAIYCFDVDDPDSPVLVDYWDVGTLNGIAGISYKAPYFYCTFIYGHEFRIYTLNSGGTFTLEDSWESYYGGLCYNETWNVFYTHAALGSTAYVLDGDDPSLILDSYMPDAIMSCGMAPDPDPAYLWTSHLTPAYNSIIDNEYIPAPLTRTTWGDIKRIF